MTERQPRPGVQMQNPPYADLSDSWFEDACGELGVIPHMVTLYCGTDCAAIAQKLRETYRCAIVLVPQEIIEPDHWAVTANGNTFWSPGV